jgi:hypothetical protein
MHHTVLFRPDLQSQVTMPVETKDENKGHRSPEGLKDGSIWIF